MNSPAESQLELLGHSEPQKGERIGPRLLGLLLTQRAWLHFLSSEWVFPEQGKQLLLGVNRLIGARPRQDEILVAVWFDSAKLPSARVLARSADNWAKCELKELVSDHHTIAWDGPLPLFAVERFSVSTSGDRMHLLAMAGGFQDMEIPEQSIDVEHITVEFAPEDHPALTNTASPPPNWDALRGAAAMATWAVPAIDPWLTLLCEALQDEAPNQSALPLHASWWKTSPWTSRQGTVSEDPLWNAILHTLSVLKSYRDLRPRSVLDEICVHAKSTGCDTSRLDRLKDSTTRLLDDRATIETAGLKDDLLGLALQLLLLRPSPERFVAWREEWPAMPPAAWWTGATLAGYLSGFRSLPKRFRGTGNARRLLALRTWKLAGDGVGPWGEVTNEKLDWIRITDTMVVRSNGLSWAEHKISRRGRWYQLDFNNGSIRQRAEMVTETHCPDQLASHLVLKDTQLMLHGDGLTDFDAKLRILNVKGKVEFELKPNFVIEKRFSSDRFRDWLATASISKPLPRPFDDQEVSTMSPLNVAPELPGLSSIESPAAQTQKLTQRAISKKSVAVIPNGLSLRLDFISTDEERMLLAEIDANPWDTKMARRVQHYGWQYDYKARKVDPSGYLGPLPKWLSTLSERLLMQGIFSEMPDQVIVNNYEGAQSISKHIDCISCFRGPIVTLSLNEAWEMVFTRKDAEGELKYKQLLARRSAAVLDGEARLIWLHEIPKRMKEGSMTRGRRVSITFRKIAI